MKKKLLSNPVIGTWETSPMYWFYNSAWAVLLTGDQTGGAFCLVEQKMRRGSGPIPHVHNYNDEWFQVISGTMDMKIDGEDRVGKAGDSIWIPRGVVHSFTVSSDECHVLNGYTPGGPEQIIIALAKPALRRELPPLDYEKPTPHQFVQFFNNYWSCQAGAGWEQTSSDPR